jgi:hypothetical protein
MRRTVRAGGNLGEGMTMMLREDILRDMFIAAQKIIAKAIALYKKRFINHGLSLDVTINFGDSSDFPNKVEITVLPRQSEHCYGPESIPAGPACPFRMRQMSEAHGVRHPFEALWMPVGSRAKACLPAPQCVIKPVVYRRLGACLLSN